MEVSAQYHYLCASTCCIALHCVALHAIQPSRNVTQRTYVPISSPQARASQHIFCQRRGLFLEISIGIRFCDAATIETGSEEGKGRLGRIIPLVLFQSFQDKCRRGRGRCFRRCHGYVCCGTMRNNNLDGRSFLLFWPCWYRMPILFVHSVLDWRL